MRPILQSLFDQWINFLNRRFGKTFLDLGLNILPLVHKTLWQGLSDQKKTKSKKKNGSGERNNFLHIENEFSVFEGSKLPLGLEFNVRLKN